MANILSPDAMRATAVRERRAPSWPRDVARLAASAHGKRDYLNHIIYRMMQDYYFGNLMLGKLDLLAGHLGLDARCPYTEPDYAHFVYNIPAKFKQKDGMVKYFFKKAITGILPGLDHLPAQAGLPHARRRAVQGRARRLGAGGDPGRRTHGDGLPAPRRARAPARRAPRRRRRSQQPAVDGAHAEPVAPALDRRRAASTVVRSDAPTASA